MQDLVIFGAGDVALLQTGGVAVVGSRNIDEAGTAFAQEVGRKVAAASPVISGGARGTDRIAMSASLEAGGRAVGVLADSLDRTVRQPDLRQLLLEGQLALLTPYAPTAGFSIGAAMGRNKVIYGLADFAVVVSSDFQTGGTWAGAVEALKAGAKGYLLKDSGPDQLIEAIHQVHRGEPSLDPAIARKVLSELSHPPKTPLTADPLTERELGVLRLVAQGKSNKEIAELLVITEMTVRTHVSNILGKLHLASRTQAALYALRQGPTPPEADPST